ncbi:PilZ domain-containing protein [Acidobacteriota bacterium]
MWIVLLVDDLKFQLDQQAGLLAREEIQIFAASSFDDAVSLANTHPPDLAIVDYRLEQSRAEELCVFLKNIPHVVEPITIVTLVQGIDEKTAESIPPWADGVLWKPLSSNDFLGVIASKLGISLRKDARVSTLLDCKAGKLESEFAYSKILNLSTSGLLLETPSALNLGDRYRCHFTLPDQTEMITTTVEIVRAVQAPIGSTQEVFRYGGRFLEQDDDLNEVIASYVEKILKSRQPSNPDNPGDSQGDVVS